MGRWFRGARGTGVFFSNGVCLGTGGLVITRRRWVEPVSALVEAVGALGTVLESGRRATEKGKGEKQLFLGKMIVF